MGMDVDWYFAKSKIDELTKLLSDQPHGKRKKIADDIIKNVDKIIKKHKPIAKI